MNSPTNINIFPKDYIFNDQPQTIPYAEETLFILLLIRYWCILYIHTTQCLSLVRQKNSSF